MRVLVACECSGTVRRAFRALGHDAWSCDILPADDSQEFHIQGDALAALHALRWDMLIAHPPCTYLCGSAEWAYGDGPYHQKVKPGTLTGRARREAREDALRFFAALLNADIPRICVENPPGAVTRRLFRPLRLVSSKWQVATMRGRQTCKPTQTIQPHQFGEDASKATCLWLFGLPPLFPTQFVAPRMVKGKPRWANQTDSGQNKLPPSTANRGGVRAVTYPGIAQAMAEQWGKLQ